FGPRQEALAVRDLHALDLTGAALHVAATLQEGVRISTVDRRPRWWERRLVDGGSARARRPHRDRRATGRNARGGPRRNVGSATTRPRVLRLRVCHAPASDETAREHRNDNPDQLPSHVSEYCSDSDAAPGWSASHDGVAQSALEEQAGIQILDLAAE